MWLEKTEEGDEQVVALMTEEGNQIMQQRSTANELAGGGCDEGMLSALTVAVYGIPNTETTQDMREHETRRVMPK